MLPIPVIPGVAETSVLNVGFGWATGSFAETQAANRNDPMAAVDSPTMARWVRRVTTGTSVVD
jgi:hypothetical protein